MELESMNHMHENPDCAWCANEDKYPEPIALLTTRLMTNLAKEKEAYIVRAFEEVGINPQVIIEQSALIQKLKSDMFTLREQIAREIEADKTPIIFENAGYEITKPDKAVVAHYAAIARGGHDSQ